MGRARAALLVEMMHSFNETKNDVYVEDLCFHSTVYAFVSV
jgi:hypothetical protein